MTAINYALMNDGVLVAMDALALAQTEDGSNPPHAFWTKVFPLPHLNGAICGTGIFQVALDWFVEVQTTIVCRDILFLDKVAPARLPVIASKYGSAMTSTIYHFGYDANEKRFRGFAYRGTDGFRSEELPYSVGVKPRLPDGLAKFEEFVEKHGLVNGFVALMKLQKEIDDELPPGERLGIGGEIHLMMLALDAQFLWKCYRFPDSNQQFADMLKRLSR